MGKSEGHRGAANLGSDGTELSADLDRGWHQVGFWSDLQPHPLPAGQSIWEDGQEDREGGTSIKSLRALKSLVKRLTGCPLSSCSSLGCPWSRVASTRPAVNAWAQATLTVDGVFFTTRKYLLGFATLPAPLFPQLSSLNGCNNSWQKCKMLAQSLVEPAEPMRHPHTSSEDSGTYWGRLCLTEKPCFGRQGKRRVVETSHLSTA